ncbi:hypothetical protein B0G69_6884 [Paraburkholderia sp. RAU2J]|nr:hypothetical protein [Paraburkholderia sp. RAU2J]RKT13703.1 hypothetical protein B0G69_6884 [Paraburkholderia sp. RAU2J]
MNNYADFTMQTHGVTFRMDVAAPSFARGDLNVPGDRFPRGKA